MLHYAGEAGEADEVSNCYTASFAAAAVFLGHSHDQAPKTAVRGTKFSENVDIKGHYHMHARMHAHTHTCTHTHTQPFYSALESGLCLGQPG